MPDRSNATAAVPSHDPSDGKGLQTADRVGIRPFAGNSNARRAAARRSVSRVSEFPRDAGEPPPAPRDVRRSQTRWRPPLEHRLQLHRGGNEVSPQTAE
jgi:hypothetical protein